MIEETVRHLYGLLVDKKYKEIESMTNGKRMRAIDIENCIVEFGRELIPYPQTIQLDIVEIRNSDPQEWSVVSPVFTVEEGYSDLSLEMSMTQVLDSFVALV